MAAREDIVVQHNIIQLDLPQLSQIQVIILIKRIQIT